MRWLISLPTVMVANSQVAANELSASTIITPRRVYTLPNVIDLSSFDQQKQSTASVQAADFQHPIVATVGRLIAVKRLDRFLHALAEARQHCPGLNGLIIGDGPERAALEALAHELQLFPDGVCFLGQRNDVSALLNQADIFLFTSDNEGFPNVLLEAMAADVPIITTPAGDAGLVVEDGKTGYVVPFEDRAAMVERLVRLAATPDLRQQFGMAGRRRVAENYDRHSLIYRLADIYRQAATHHSYHSILPLLPPSGEEFSG
jgi:glycosyltransferase involved in cell wall biosynthesis